MKIERYNWSQADIEDLRAMWFQGATLAAIGKALGCTRNAVAGKARRLGLPRRPSPIKRRTDRGVYPEGHVTYPGEI